MSNTLLSSPLEEREEHRPAQGATFARCVNFGPKSSEKSLFSSSLALEHTVFLLMVPFTGIVRQFQGYAYLVSWIEKGR